MWGAKRSQGVRNCEMWQIVPYNCASESNIVEVQIFYISADHPHYFALFVTWFNWLWKDIWIHVAENCFFSSSYNNGISLESKYLKTLLYSDKSLMSLRNTSYCVARLLIWLLYRHASVSGTYPSTSVGRAVGPSYFRISILSASLRPHKASRRQCSGRHGGWHGGRHGGANLGH